MFKANEADPYLSRNRLIMGRSGHFGNLQEGWKPQPPAESILEGP